MSFKTLMFSYMLCFISYMYLECAITSVYPFRILTGLFCSIQTSTGGQALAMVRYSGVNCEIRLKVQ